MADGVEGALRLCQRTYEGERSTRGPLGKAGLLKSWGGKQLRPGPSEQKGVSQDPQEGSRIGTAAHFSGSPLVPLTQQGGPASVTGWAGWFPHPIRLLAAPPAPHLGPLLAPAPAGPSPPLTGPLPPPRPLPAPGPHTPVFRPLPL